MRLQLGTLQASLQTRCGACVYLKSQRKLTTLVEDVSDAISEAKRKKSQTKTKPGAVFYFARIVTE